MTKTKQAKDIMEKKTASVRHDATLKEVSELLIKNRLSGIPVVNNKGSLIGFISERDIIEAISQGNFENKKTKDIMTKNVISINEDTSIEEVSRIFSKYPYRYIPVCKNKNIVGVISRKDVIEKLLGQYY